MFLTNVYSNHGGNTFCMDMQIYRQFMEDCGAERATVATPYKVVHGASDVAVGQRGYS
jgi:hypothetical protein